MPIPVEHIRHYAWVPSVDAAATRLWCAVLALMLVVGCSHGPSEGERLARLRIPTGNAGAGDFTPMRHVYEWGPCGTISPPTVRLATAPSDLHAVLCINPTSAADGLYAEYLTDAGQIDRDTTQEALEHGAIFLAQTPLPSIDDVRTLDAQDWELSVHLNGTTGVVSRGGVKRYRVRWRQMSNGNPVEIELIGGRDGPELLALARNVIDGTPAVG